MNELSNEASLICAVIPAYKVQDHVLEVVAQVLEHVDHVFVVDDACPMGSGGLVQQRWGDDSRVTVLFQPVNTGVGGAVMRGYQEAQRQGYTIVVKVDGDGQMDAAFIGALVGPLLAGEADYSKGNRFHDPRGLQSMPTTRLLGNAGLSFVTKLSTGYWQLMDPTNGFTALHVGVLPWLPLHKVSQRYFFESDMLYSLGLVQAVVLDVPMPARYGEEQSNLDVKKALFEFGGKHLVRFSKRLLYQYFLRGFSMGSVCLVLSLPLLIFALVLGGFVWANSVQTGVAATAGTIMLVALPALLGVQLLLGFFSLDMARAQQRPLHRMYKYLNISKAKRLDN